MSFARVLSLAVTLALIGVGASADTYQILRGTLTGPDGPPAVLEGHFETSPLIGLDGRRPLLVGDFALEAGNRSFTRAGPIEFEGLTALITVSNTIGLLGNDVEAVRLRSGGELVSSNGDRATFRFLDFRSDASDGGHGVGVLGDGAPRRLDLAGTLYEVEETYEIWRLPCLFPSPEPAPIPILEPGPIGAPGGDITLRAGPLPGPDPTAPSDPGGSIVIGGPGTLEPADVGFIIVPILPVIICQGLEPVPPAVEHAVGHFDLVATAARPIPIDVRPAQTNNVVIPGSPGHVPVAILAARALDVCPVDEGSLRLGDGEAEPIAWSGRELTRRRDVDGDGGLDLVARFRVRDTGIAFGDDSICLDAQTTCGETLEGCDAIQTLPGR